MDPNRLVPKNLLQTGFFFFQYFYTFWYVLRHIKTIVAEYKKKKNRELQKPQFFTLQSKATPFFTSPSPVLPLPSLFHPSQSPFFLNLHQGPIYLAFSLACSSSLCCLLLPITVTHATASQTLELKVHFPFPTVFAHCNQRIEKVL